MTKMAAMPILWLKTLKNLLLQNYKSYDLETWHVASVTHDDARLTFTYFTARSNWVADTLKCEKLLQSQILGKTSSE